MFLYQKFVINWFYYVHSLENLIFYGFEPDTKRINGLNMFNIIILFEFDSILISFRVLNLNEN